VCAVLPLLAAEVWSGFRFAQSDQVLSVIAATEQPLSVRSPGGVWAMLLALAWFGLAYPQRRLTLWETGLVLLGGAAILARLGNGWLYALAMVLPLARQLSTTRARVGVLVCAGAASVAMSGYVLVTTRPPAIPPAAQQAAISATANATGTVFADWRWAPDLQRALGSRTRVLSAGGPATESADFWVDYLRISQGHERWQEALTSMNADLLVLETNASRPAANLVRASAEWRVLYDAEGALVARRASQ
jgi:hypothetical protein